MYRLHRSVYVNLFKKDKDLADGDHGEFLVGGLVREVLRE
jgi:hypothetical protein